MPYVGREDVEVEAVLADVSGLVEYLVEFPDLLRAGRSVEGRVPLTLVDVPARAGVLGRL